MEGSIISTKIISLFLVVIAALALWLYSAQDNSLPQLSQPVTPVEIAENSMAKTINLRLGHDSAEGSAIHLGAMEFARMVREKSAGRIHVTVFPAQKLGTDQEMIKALSQGDLDISIPPSAKLGNNNVALFDTPFLFRDRQHVYEVLDGPLGKAVLSRLQSMGLHCPVGWESGFKQFTSSLPIKSPADFQGLRVRTMKSPIIMNQYRALGAKPIPIDFHKTRQALKDGVVNAQENPLGSIFNMGFHEVQNYLTMSNHGYLAQLFCFSQIIFEGLTESDREILTSAAIDTARFQRIKSEEQDQQYLEKLEQSDIQIVELSKKEIEQFRRATKVLINDSIYYLDADLRELASEIFLAQNNPGDIIIGLDADLSRGSAPAGISIRRGIELAIDDINREGGVLGRSLALNAKDHQGNKETGLENIHNLASNKDVIAIFSGLHSPIALAEVPLVNELGMPYLVPWAAATNIVDNGFNPNWVFRLSINDADAGGFLVSEAIRNSKKIGMLLENTGWGQSNEKAIRTALAELGLQPTTVEWFSWGEDDFSEQLNRFSETGTEVIILVANAPEGSVFIRDLAQFHNSYNVISHWGITGGYFFERTESLGDEMNLSFIQTFSFLNSNSKASQHLISNYIKKYKKTSVRDIIAPTGTAHAYDLVHLLVRAIEKAGSSDRSKVRQALENLGPYTGLVKTYEKPFTKDRHEALNAGDLQLARFAFDGVITPVIQSIDNTERPKE